MTILYTRDHEWVDTERPHAVTVGITLHAQDTLGDIVFVELPEVGRSLRKGDVAGVVESVKAAADLYMPISGDIIAVNETLRGDPSLANSDPTGAAWFFRVNASDPSEFEALMQAAAYDEFVKTG